MLDIVNAQHALLHCRIRHHHKVVLVHAHTVLTFLLQCPNDLERHVSNAYGLADRIFTLIKQLFDNGLAYQSNLGIFLHIFIGKVDTCGNLVFSNLQIVGRATIHCSRPVLGSIHQLATTVDHRTDHGDIFGVLGNQFTVSYLERLHIAGAHADATTPLVGTHHHDEVGTHIGELIRRTLFQALTQIDHSDDGSNTDDDAKHGKGRARLVAHQGFRRNSYEVQDIHGQ